MNAVAFETHVGESLLTRNQFLNSFKQLGPPDHLHIINSESDVSAGDKTDDYKQSCFMHLVGLDNSSVSSMAATIAKLLTSKNLKAWFDEQTSIKGTLSTFNPFSAIDVRIQVSLPGGVHSYGVDANDKQINIDEFKDLFWHELYVVSILRAHTLPTPVSSTLGPLYRENVFPDEKTLLKFLKSAYFVYLESSPNFAVHPLQGNFLLSHIKSILNDLGRIDLLSKWIDGSLFKELTPLIDQPDPYLPLAMIHGLAASHQQAMAFKHLQQLPTLLHLLFYQHILKSNHNHPMCSKVYKAILFQQPSHPQVWLNYAHCLVTLEDYELALIALNSCPISNHDALPSIEFYRTPKPTARFCHIREHIDVLEQLTLIPDGSDSKFLSNSKQYAAMPGVLKETYQLLCKMTHTLTWDGLLKVRNKVFVMDTQDSQPQQPPQRLCEKWLDDLFLMLYDDLSVYLVVKNELTRNPNTQYKATEWYHYGLIANRLLKQKECEFAFNKLTCKSPTAILKMVAYLIDDYQENPFKVDRPSEQPSQLYGLYMAYWTGVAGSMDTYEVYFDVYGCNWYKNPFYSYMIQLCQIHSRALVQLWILQSALTKEERRLMEDLYKYCTKLELP